MVRNGGLVGVGDRRDDVVKDGVASEFKPGNWDKILHFDGRRRVHTPLIGRTAVRIMVGWVCHSLEEKRLECKGVTDQLLELYKMWWKLNSDAII